MTRRVPAAKPAGGSQYEAADEHRLSIYRLANLFLRERRIMLALPFVTTITAVAITLSKKPQWEAESKIVAEGVQTTSSLSVVAAQFGVSMPGGSGGVRSPDFYAGLLKSPEVLTPVASRSYSTVMPGNKPASGMVWKLYGFDTPPAKDAVQLSRDILAKNAKTSSDPITGVVTLTLNAPSHDLSIELNREILKSAGDFLQERRQARAAAETQFVESRLSDAKSQLVTAEANLRDFVSQNRQYQTSPQLSLEAAQLERNVSLRQQVFVTLSQAYEQSRIEVMRNIPLISVLQRPEYAVSRKAPSLFRNILLGLILGTLVAMGVVITRTKLAREPLENPADFEEFRALLKEAVPKPVRRGQPKLRGTTTPG
jgi:uncharacterized protein involved in exopolysaccharide biosynthesis